MGKDRSPEHVNEAVKDITKSLPAASEADIGEQLRDDLLYINNDTLVANPASILGRVYYEDKTSGVLRPYIYSVPVELDQESTLSAPLVRKELVVNRTLAAKVSVLSMLTAGGSADHLYEFRMIDNAVARAKNDAKFREIIKTWATDPLISEDLLKEDYGRITVVMGVVQKYVSQKRYKKYTGQLDGGGWGVQVDGSVYLNDSQYSLDVIYGLELLVFSEARTQGDAEQFPVTTADDIESSDVRDRLSETLSMDREFAQAFM